MDLIWPYTKAAFKQKPKKKLGSNTEFCKPLYTKRCKIRDVDFDIAIHVSGKIILKIKIKTTIGDQ